jgi:hypothetical protein
MPDWVIGVVIRVGAPPAPRAPQAILHIDTEGTTSEVTRPCIRPPRNHRRSVPRLPTSDDLDALRPPASSPTSNAPGSAHFAADFPTLWSDPATPQRERKRMVRLLIDDVTLIKTDHINAHIRLRGGQTHSITLPIPSQAWQARQTHPDTLAALDRLLQEHTDTEAAALLNAAGHRSGEGKPFTARIVLELRRSNALLSPRRPAPSTRTPDPPRSRRTARRAHLDDQGLAPRRTARLAQGQRQEPAALRTPGPHRPPAPRQARQPHQKPSSHPTRAKRCTVKPTPCPTPTRPGPSIG